MIFNKIEMFKPFLMRLTSAKFCISLFSCFSVVVCRWTVVEQQTDVINIMGKLLQRFVADVQGMQM